MSYDSKKFLDDLDHVLCEVREILIAKNAAYSDSALNPTPILSKLSVKERLLVRMDDKLNRLAQGSDNGEDTKLDLLGYLILERIDAKRNSYN